MTKDKNEYTHEGWFWFLPVYVWFDEITGAPEVTPRYGLDFLFGAAVFINDLFCMFLSLFGHEGGFLLILAEIDQGACKEEDRK